MSALCHKQTKCIAAKHCYSVALSVLELVARYRPQRLGELQSARNRNSDMDAAFQRVPYLLTELHKF